LSHISSLGEYLCRISTWSSSPWRSLRPFDWSTWKDWNRRGLPKGWGSPDGPYGKTFKMPGGRSWRLWSKGKRSRSKGETIPWKGRGDTTAKDAVPCGKYLSQPVSHCDVPIVVATKYKEILTTWMTMDQSVAVKVGASRRGKGPGMRYEMLPCPSRVLTMNGQGIFGTCSKAGPSSSFNLEMGEVSALMGREYKRRRQRK
jgi:hypothetical protein